MKSFIVAAAIVGLTTAQVPACGQTCLTNMGNLYADFGCSSATDYACLCNDVNYAYGIRDCSTAVCQGDQSAVQAALAQGLANCQGAASSGATLSATSVFASGAGSATATITATGGSASGSGASGSGSGSGSGGSGVPITTEPLVGVITTDGSTITTTTGSSTIYQGGTIPVTTESGSTILGVPQFTTITTGGSTEVSAYSTSTITGSGAASSASESASSAASGASSSAESVASSASGAASSAASSASGAASSAASSATGSGNAAPAVTMAVNGFVGAAGLAAVMLL